MARVFNRFFMIHCYQSHGFLSLIYAFTVSQHFFVFVVPWTPLWRFLSKVNKAVIGCWIFSLYLRHWVRQWQYIGPFGFDQQLYLRLLLPYVLLRTLELYYLVILQPLWYSNRRTTSSLKKEQKCPDVSKNAPIFKKCILFVFILGLNLIENAMLRVS